MYICYDTISQNSLKYLSLLQLYKLGFMYSRTYKSGTLPQRKTRYLVLNIKIRTVNGGDISRNKYVAVIY